jgi:hypothetical protein
LAAKAVDGKVVTMFDFRIEFVHAGGTHCMCSRRVENIFDALVHFMGGVDFEGLQMHQSEHKMKFNALSSLSPWPRWPPRRWRGMENSEASRVAWIGKKVLTTFRAAT